MCVQLHGDASFTGQGVVMESLGLSETANHFVCMITGQTQTFIIKATCPTSQAEEVFIQS